MFSLLNCHLSRSINLVPGKNYMAICRGLKLCSVALALQKGDITPKLQRMIERGTKSKPKKKKSHSAANVTNFTIDPIVMGHYTAQSKVVHKERSQRAGKLDTILLQHVQQIFLSQELDSRISELNVEIVKVRISRDLNSASVYWAGSFDNKRNEEIQGILDKNAGTLRGLLIERGLFGKIPYISFVKDKTQAFLKDLSRRMEVADYGPEFRPVDLNNDMPLEERETKSLNTSLTNNGIYGLDHDAISKRLKVSMNKVQTRSKDRGAEEEEEETGSKLEKLEKLKKALAKEKAQVSKKKMRQRALLNRLGSRGGDEDEEDESDDEISERYVDEDSEDEHDEDREKDSEDEYDEDRDEDSEDEYDEDSDDERYSDNEFEDFDDGDRGDQDDPFGDEDYERNIDRKIEPDWENEDTRGEQLHEEGRGEDRSKYDVIYSDDEDDYDR